MQINLDNFLIEVSGSVADEKFADKWNSIHPDPGQFRYFKFLESVKPADISFRYFVVYRKKEDQLLPCARIYAQTVKFTGRNIKLSNPVASFAIKSFLLFRPFQLLVVGNMFAVDFCPLEYNEQLIDVNDLADLLCRLSFHVKHDVLILKDIPSAFDSNFIKKERLRPFHADMTMTLDIREKWRSLPDYLNDLTKKYRKRAEKILEKRDGMSLKKIGPELFLKHEKKIGELLQNVSSKQMVRIGMVDQNYLKQYLADFPETFSITGIFYNQELIAFYTGIDRGEMLEIHYIGMDYKLNQRLYLYFNILFYCLEEAIAGNKRQLELGRTAREAKASLGAKAILFNDYIRMNSRLSDLLADKLTNVFENKMGKKWMDRDPLKPE